MNAIQKAKHLILLRGKDFELIPSDVEINEENIDEVFNQYSADWELQDAQEDIRCSGSATDLATPYSRHYECDFVARQAVDGSWIGWPYWYGGGKYSEPESIDWLSDVVDLDCTEKEVTKIERTFAKK